MRQPVSTIHAPQAIGPYSQAIRAGDYLFVSGQIPLDPATGTLVSGSIADETRRVLDNLGAILDAAGSSFDRVVKTTVYVASHDRADLVAAWEVVSRAFGDHDAPSTLLGVAVLGYPDQLVEVEAIAALRPSV